MIRPLKIANDVAERYAEHERSLDVAQVCRAMILALGSGVDRATVLRQLGAPDRVVEVNKAAQDAAEVASSGMVGSWRTAAQAFLRSLQSVGVFDAIANGGGVNVPWFNFASVMTAIAAGAEGESQAKAVRALTATPQTMTEHKGAAIVAMSAEHLREIGPAGLAAVNTELRRGMVRATDSIALTQLLTGVSPITSQADPVRDMADLLLALTRDSLSPLVFAIGINAWAELDALPEAEVPAALRRWPVIPSDAVDADSLVGIVADSILVSDQGIGLDVARHASLQLDDDPSGASDSPPVPANMVSLWQTGSIALRVERRFKLDAARAGAVAQLDGITWNSGSP